MSDTSRLQASEIWRERRSDSRAVTADEHNPGNALLARVRAYALEIAARAAEAETARTMPRDLVDSLRKAGVFGMVVPKHVGGPGIDFATTLRVIEELAAADGSAGWIAMIGCNGPYWYSHLPKERFEAIYANGPDVIGGGSTRNGGVAEIGDGGFLVNGKWGFTSGCLHADWLYCFAIVTLAGTPVPSRFPGVPRIRVVVLPAHEFTVIENWDSVGLRGTGSHDITLKDKFVREDQSFDMQMDGELALGPANVLAHYHMAAVSLGIAQGAFNDVVALACGGKARAYATSGIADSVLFQKTLGEVEADIMAARAMLYECSQDALERFEEWRPGDASFITRALQAIMWVTATSVRVVDACYTAGGGSSLLSASPLQRRLRDIHAVTQHWSVQNRGYVAAGNYALGKPVNPFSVIV
ncbi:MAG: acyl-CoA dehydrogenase family protein [Alphaproteobacteria bacterium]